MMNLNLKFSALRCSLTVLIFFVLTFFSACGGGGSSSDGGSDFSGNSNIFPTESRSASTGIRLLHGAIDARPIELRFASKEAAVATARFSLAYPFVSMSGTDIVTVLPVNALTPTLFSSEITLERNARATLLLFGNVTSLGLSTVYLPDSRNPDLGTDMAAVRVLHSLLGASELRVTGATASAGTAAFGQASTYLEVPAGLNTLGVERAIDGQAIYSGSVELAGDKHYSLFVTGRVGYFTNTKLLED